RVNIKNDVPFFLVSLIEHKTKVEYNVVMQIFRYMIYIWEAYEKEAENLQKGISRQKGFKYPPILPIVYYEGKEKWTVPLDFKSRIMEGEAFARYIPDFEYYLVPLRSYSSQELLDREDEISLLMLINRMQTEEDIAEFRRLPTERLQSILKSTPQHLVDIIADVLLAFLLKTNLSADEAEEVVGKLREKNMGQLFENMDPIDIPARRREIAEQRKELVRQKNELTEQRNELTEQRNELAEQRNELAEQRNELAEQRNELAEEYKKKNKQLGEKLAQADEKLMQAERKEQQAEAKNQQIEAEKQRIEAERQQIETEKRQMQIQLEQRNAELEELRRAYEKLLKEKS
ncbi:MAG: Rpn family recombination-promoting nuclease/putative transposase, partial [Acetatifactor sp.]|nr:Rpn family recombination-promoting nuclease/putative transposase [Acetatifactor sp.]